RSAHRRAALDGFAAGTIGPVARRYREARQRYGRARDEYRERTERARELAQEAGLLRLGLDEIAAVDPQPAEDEAIAAEVRRLGELDSVREVAEYVHGALSGQAASLDGDGTGISDLASAARSRVDQVDDPDL